MIALIQRVSEASVEVDGKSISRIGSGLLVLAGFEESDGEDDIAWLSRKIACLRIFDDASGVMNLSLLDTGGELLVVSQFTLHASTKKGNRPSYIRAARPETAKPLYERLVAALESETGKKAHTGEFGAMMRVALVNDGPVTIIIDTKDKK
jgi:D-tyrosyl-tRNA(Tyr) deacylase